MPQVPTYDTPQVEPRALPGVRQESVATPELLSGAATAGIDTLGKGLSLAGGNLANIATHMQEREDMTAVLGVEAARKEAMVQFDTDNRQNRQGAKAAGVTTDVKQWWDDAKKADFEALKTDRQRELYLRRMSSTRAQHLKSASDFEVNQGEVALDQSAKATVVAAINAAAADPTESNIAVQKNAILTANRALGFRKGWAEGKDGKPGVLDVVNGEDITRLHEQVIGALVATNKDAAAAYFEKYKNEIDGSKRDKIGESAMKATAEAQGRAAAGDVWAAIGPAGGIDKMNEALREKFKDNTFALSAAEADLRNRVSMFEHGEKTRTDSQMAKLNIAAANGASIPQLRGMPEFNQLLTSGPAGEKAIAQLLLHQETLEATRASRAAANANRAASNEARAEAAERRQQYRLTREGLDIFTQYMMNPDALRALSPDEVINLRTQIGDENMQRLAQMHNSITKNEDAFRNARVGADIMRDVISKAGFDPDRKDQSDTDKARISQLTVAIQSGVANAAKQKGRALSYDETVQEAQRILDDKVRVPGFWGFTYTDRPAATLTPAEAKNAAPITKAGVIFDKEAGRVLQSTDIPKEFTAEAMRQMRARGVPPTQENIAQAWLANRAQWRQEQKNKPTGAAY